MNSERRPNLIFQIDGVPFAVGGAVEAVMGLTSSQIFKQKIDDAHEKEFHLAQPSGRQGVDYNWEMQKVQNDLIRADIGSFFSAAVIAAGFFMMIKSGVIQRRKKE